MEYHSLKDLHQKPPFQLKAHSRGRPKGQKCQYTLKQWQQKTFFAMSLLLDFTFSEAYCVQQEQRGGATVRYA
jgi:hypothetical protein